MIAFYPLYLSIFKSDKSVLLLLLVFLVFIKCIYEKWTLYIYLLIKYCKKVIIDDA